MGGSNRNGSETAMRPNRSGDHGMTFPSINMSTWIFSRKSKLPCRDFGVHLCF